MYRMYLRNSTTFGNRLYIEMPSGTTKVFTTLESLERFVYSCRDETKTKILDEMLMEQYDEICDSLN